LLSKSQVTVEFRHGAYIIYIQVSNVMNVLKLGPVIVGARDTG